MRTLFILLLLSLSFSDEVVSQQEVTEAADWQHYYYLHLKSIFQACNLEFDSISNKPTCFDSVDISKPGDKCFSFNLKQVFLFSNGSILVRDSFHLQKDSYSHYHFLFPESISAAIFDSLKAHSYESFSHKSILDKLFRRQPLPKMFVKNHMRLFVKAERIFNTKEYPTCMNSYYKKDFISLSAYY